MLADSTRMDVSAVRGGMACCYAGVTERDIDDFCDAVLENIFDSFTTVAAGSFAQGFCAAIDAMGSRTVDFGDPVGTVNQAWADVNDFTGAKPKVTAVMECVPGPKAAAK